jgi:uncharacterized protein YegJ (DUF2314 family)
MAKMRLLSRRHHGGLLAIAACAVAGSACHAQEPKPIRRPEGSVMPVRNSDAAMNAAIADAQQNLPVFWSIFDRKPSGFADYRIKIAFPAPGGSEAMWIVPTAHQGDDIDGLLTDDSVFRTDLKKGRTVHVTASQVDDWGYSHKGQLWGNFTTVLLFGEMTPDEAAFTRSVLGPTRVEPGV